jgi:predicted secreted protein
MGWATAIMVYVVLWWLAWFAVLPLGVRIPEEVPYGQATSAPENPRLLWKAGLATVIAALLWALVFWLVVYDPLGLDLRETKITQSR